MLVAKCWGKKKNFQGRVSNLHLLLSTLPFSKYTPKEIAEVIQW